MYTPKHTGSPDLYDRANPGSTETDAGQWACCPTIITDLSDDVPVNDVFVPRDIELRSFTQTDGPLTGMTLLKGTATANAQDHGFETPLYRELSMQPGRETEITLIPYFAWANRGPADMSVWLPLAS